MEVVATRSHQQAAEIKYEGDWRGGEKLRHGKGQKSDKALISGR
jgi:hypothetical protein